MIQGQIFNFESNLLDASKYRSSLQNLGNGSASNQVEPFLIKSKFNFKKLKFSFLKRRNIIDAELISTNFRNLSSFLYFKNKNLNYIKETQRTFDKKTKEFFKVLNKDLEILESSVLEVNTRLNSKNNKVKHFSIFQEKDFLEQYDLMDEKRSIRFRKNQQCDFKRGYIECKEMNASEIDIVSIEVVKENSYFSDTLRGLDIDEETSYIYRKDKFWNYIVGATDSLEDLQELPHKNGRLQLIVNFDGYEDLNNIFIEFGSSLPVELNENRLEYFEKSTQSYKFIDSPSVQNNSNRVEIAFKTIRTNKIKVSLLQTKYHDTSFVYDESLENIKKDLILDRSFLSHKSEILNFELKRVYDFSILNFKCRRKLNREIGFYRESNPVVVNKPLSAQIKLNKFYEDKNCFIEKYAHVVLYGEEGFTPNKIENKNYTTTKRANIKIPLPNSPYKERELLVLKDKTGKVCFFPNVKKPIEETIKVFKVNINDGEEVECILKDEYEVSLNKGNNFIENGTYIPNEEPDIDTKSEIYNFCIKILEPSSSHYYIVEYILNETISCGYGNKILLKKGELVFNESFQSSVGFIRPSFIIRNKSNDSQSSKIQSYTVLIEEIEINEKSYIEYETFLELERKGSSNVV